MAKQYHVHEAYHPPRRRIRAVMILLVIVGLLVAATVVVRQTYYANLRPVSNSAVSQTVTIPTGLDVDGIADLLIKQQLIKSAWAFKLYIHNQDAANVLQAGTYSLRPNMTVNEIVAVLTHGKVVTDLITIIPGQTIAQIQQTFINAGYAQADVEAAFDPSNYDDVPVLVDKPATASLEGFLYPDSYQKNSSTKPEAIVRAALNEMQQHLTSTLRDDFAAQGLSAYQGLTLASIVEKEVSKDTDRPQVAQVFLSRLHQNMMLGSDVTAFYGATLAGQKPLGSYDSPYNTLKNRGLPPTPIATVSDSSLKAVAEPAQTDWLYFVAGDDGTTHFSRTLQEHDAAAAQYCKKLCQ